MSLDQIIEVLQAAKQGEVIQFRNKNTSNWATASSTNNYSDMSWNFGLCDYRIKCEEPEELWVNLYAADSYEGEFTGYGYTSKSGAIQRAAPDCRSKAVRYIRATDQTR